MNVLISTNKMTFVTFLPFLCPGKSIWVFDLPKKIISLDRIIIKACL
jgi:hypothetical protein